MIRYRTAPLMLPIGSTQTCVYIHAVHPSIHPDPSSSVPDFPNSDIEDHFLENNLIGQNEKNKQTTVFNQIKEVVVGSRRQTQDPVNVCDS